MSCKVQNVWKDYFLVLSEGVHTVLGHRRLVNISTLRRCVWESSMFQVGIDVYKSKEWSGKKCVFVCTLCVPCVLMIVLHAATTRVSRPVASTARRRSNGAVMVLLAAPLMKPAAITIPGVGHEASTAVFVAVVVVCSDGASCGPPALEFNFMAGIVGIRCSTASSPSSLQSQQSLNYVLSDSRC